MNQLVAGAFAPPGIVPPGIAYMAYPLTRRNLRLVQEAKTRVDRMGIKGGRSRWWGQEAMVVQESKTRSLPANCVAIEERRSWEEEEAEIMELFRGVRVDQEAIRLFLEESRKLWEMKQEEPVTWIMQTELWFGPPFTGEVDNRYLEYLAKLDWDSFQNHLKYFPRKHRSEDEKRLIFEKWAAHFGVKYLNAKWKKMRYASFKRTLEGNDGYNSLHSRCKLDEDSDVADYPFSCYTTELKEWQEVKTKIENAMENVKLDGIG